jgi:hypothetical protein
VPLRAPSSSTAEQHRRAAPPSSTAQQHRPAAPPSSTAQQHRRAAPPSSTAEQHRRAAPPSSTAQQHRPAAPPSSTAQQLGPAARASVRPASPHTAHAEWPLEGTGASVTGPSSLSTTESSADEEATWKNSLLRSWLPSPGPGTPRFSASTPGRRSCSRGRYATVHCRDNEPCVALEELAPFFLDPRRSVQRPTRDDPRPEWYVRTALLRDERAVLFASHETLQLHSAWPS